MPASAESHRQQIGYFYTNSSARVCKPNKISRLFCQVFSDNILLKCKTFIKNSLSIDTNLFVLLSMFFYTALDTPEPISTSVISILLTTFCINMCQFLIINTYSLLSRSTCAFYSLMAVFANLNSLEFITFTYYHKLLDILTHGDIHPNPGPPPLFSFSLCTGILTQFQRMTMKESPF